MHLFKQDRVGWKAESQSSWLQPVARHVEKGLVCGTGDVLTAVEKPLTRLLGHLDAASDWHVIGWLSGPFHLDLVALWATFLFSNFYPVSTKCMMICAF